MATQDVQIAYAIPGRIRLKVGKVKGNAALAECRIKGSYERMKFSQSSQALVTCGKS